MRKVLYSGFFDLLHIGHIKALEEAASYGDYLIVHIGGDQESKCVKGALRPIVSGKDRKYMLNSLKCVDKVIYDEHYLSFNDLLDKAKPNVVIRNLGSFNREEEEECKKRGITIVKVNQHTETTTSALIKKIQEGPKDNPKLAGVNFVLHDGMGNVILQWRERKRNIRCPGTWAIPGGGLEPGEDVLTCVIREIKEEVGIDVHQDQIKFLCDHKYTWGDINRFFLVDYFGLAGQAILGNEGKMKWFKLDRNLMNKLADNQWKAVSNIWQESKTKES